MPQEYLNIYQTARRAAGITQERAAELLGISVESVRSYESGARIPPDDAVVRMADVYCTQFLAYQHLRASAEIARTYMPEVEAGDLATAILKLQKEVNDFLKCREDLLDITCDGIISEDERPRWEQILKELDDINAAIMALKFAKHN